MNLKGVHPTAPAPGCCRERCLLVTAESGCYRTRAQGAPGPRWRAPRSFQRRRTERLRQDGQGAGQHPRPRSLPGLQLLVRKLSPACWAVAKDMRGAAPWAGPAGTESQRLGVRTGASQEGRSGCGREQSWRRPQALHRLSQALALSMLCSLPNARDPQEDEWQMQCRGCQAHGGGVRAKPDFMGGEGTTRRPSSPRPWGSQGPPSVSD